MEEENCRSQTEIFLRQNENRQRAANGVEPQIRNLYCAQVSFTVPIGSAYNRGPFHRRMFVIIVTSTDEQRNRWLGEVKNIVIQYFPEDGIINDKVKEDNK